MTPEAISTLLQPYVSATPEASSDWPHVCGQLAIYLELLLKWNDRTNLTAIRDPEQIVRRHFGESLFAAAHLSPCATLLDFGSGAGFPGIPIQLLRPEIHVSLAESQGKKAAFLREAVRALGLTTEILPCRVENLPTSRTFEITTLRAVDKMQAALPQAAKRTTHQIVLLTTSRNSTTHRNLPDFETTTRLEIPLSATSIIETLTRVR